MVYMQELIHIFCHFFIYLITANKMCYFRKLCSVLGLMPNLTPANSKKDPKKRYGWKKYNKYFDESTIKIR